MAWFRLLVFAFALAAAPFSLDIRGVQVVASDGGNGLVAKAMQGHCQQQPRHQSDGGAAEKCCVSVCAAALVFATVEVGALSLAPSEPVSGAGGFFTGLDGEVEPPPPRFV